MNAITQVLIDKRAELAGEVQAIEKRLSALREDLHHIDHTIRIIDPTLAPMDIRPRIPRNPPTVFKHGQFRRAILDTLRKAESPLSPREIAERLAAGRPEVNSAKALTDLVQKVRCALPSIPGIVGEKIGKGEAMVWRLASEVAEEG